LVVFSVIIIGLSAYYLIIGAYTSLSTSIIRIVSCAAVSVISVLMLIKRDRYIITDEKVMLYGKWEANFSEINSVSLHDNLFGFIEIETEKGTFTVPASDISCSLKVFAEILSERTKLAEKKGKSP